MMDRIEMFMLSYETSFRIASFGIPVIMWLLAKWYYIRLDGYKSACRIVERTDVDGSIRYVIQQRHFFFRWWWVDAWVNSIAGAYCTDSFPTREEACDNLCYFDGSTSSDEVIRCD